MAAHGEVGPAGGPPASWAWSGRTSKDRGGVLADEPCLGTHVPLLGASRDQSRGLCLPVGPEMISAIQESHGNKSYGIQSVLTPGWVAFRNKISE